VSNPPPEQPPPGGTPPYGQQPPYPYGQQPPYPYGHQQPYPYWQQQQWRPPPPIDPRQLRPSRLWYLLSVVPAIVGFAVATLFVIAFVDRLDPDLDHFTTDRPAEVQLKQGERAVYVQIAGTRGARDVPASDLDCRVTFIGDPSRPLPVDTAGSFSLDVNSDRYESRLSFDAPADGRYRVACDGPRDLPLAIGPHFSAGLFVPLVVAVIAFLVGAGLAAAIAIVTGVKRSNHKQRLQREAVAGG
jgi:hypothetical protein